MLELNMSTTLLIRVRMNQSMPGITCHGQSVLHRVLEV